MGFLVAQEPTATIEDLPRSPHLAMHHLMSQFEIKPGFALELVASEPLVVDPVAMCFDEYGDCLLYTSPSPRDGLLSRMPSSA